MRLRQPRREEILRQANSTAPNQKKLKEKPEEHPCSLKKLLPRCKVRFLEI